MNCCLSNLEMAALPPDPQELTDDIQNEQFTMFFKMQVQNVCTKHQAALTESTTTKPLDF